MIDALAALPPGFLLGAAFLSARMNQLRAASLALLFAVTYALARYGDFLLPQARMAGSALALTIGAAALSMAGPWLGRTASLFSRRGLLALLLISTPFALLVVLQGKGWWSLQWASFHPRWILSDLTLVFFAVFAAASLAQGDSHQRFFTRVALLAFVPALAALNEATALLASTQARLSEVQGILTLAFTASGFLFLYGNYRVYWRKVYLDELTGLPNRRALDEAAANLPDRFVVAMVDIDHFKAFNDNYGHDAGDRVLAHVGQHLARETSGRSYRYGGEEFCVLLPGMSLPTARLLLERARARLEARPFWITRPGGGRKGARVTVSAGLASSSAQLKDAESVRRAADEALYKAKRGGRNRVAAGGPEGGGRP